MAAARRWPPLAALNGGGDGGAYADVQATSCPSAGNCAVGGYYQLPESPSADGPPPAFPFVATEKNGTWSSARPVPGTRSFPSAEGLDDFGSVLVSCTAPGNCVAAGSNGNGNGNGNGNSTAFVATQTRGRWSDARPVAGLPDYSARVTGATVESVSCPSPGNGAVGGYDDAGPAGPSQQAFLVAEAGRKWRQATAVPGLAALDTGQFSQVASVSCVRSGACLAGGYYTSRAYSYEPPTANAVENVFVTSKP